jgi:drug/metabolite transporter (DMT)-like permease
MFGVELSQASRQARDNDARVRAQQGRRDFAVLGQQSGAPGAIARPAFAINGSLPQEARRSCGISRAINGSLPQNRAASVGAIHRTRIAASAPLTRPVRLRPECAFSFTSRPVLNVVAPALFVLIWSTGFVVARAIDGVADPNLFLVVRFVASAALFALLAVALRAEWPAPGEWPKHLVAGALLQGVYVGGGYWAVSHGLSPAVMALLGTLQPMVTALIAQRLFAERVGRTLLGRIARRRHRRAARAVARLFALADGDGLPPPVIAVALLSVAAITAGTLVQKTSLAAANLISASAVQYAGGALVVAIAAWLLGESLWRPGARCGVRSPGRCCCCPVWPPPCWCGWCAAVRRRGDRAASAGTAAGRSAGLVAVRRTSGHTADRRLRTRTRWRAAVPSRHGSQSIAKLAHPHQTRAMTATVSMRRLQKPHVASIGRHIS